MLAGCQNVKGLEWAAWPAVGAQIECSIVEEDSKVAGCMLEGCFKRSHPAPHEDDGVTAKQMALLHLLLAGAHNEADGVIQACHRIIRRHVARSQWRHPHFLYKRDIKNLFINRHHHAV